MEAPARLTSTLARTALALDDERTEDAWPSARSGTLGLPGLAQIDKDPLQNH
jgi:hypothetical protein